MRIVLFLIVALLVCSLFVAAEVVSGANEALTTYYAPMSPKSSILENHFERFINQMMKLGKTLPPSGHALISSSSSKESATVVNDGYLVDFTMYSPPNHSCTYDGPDLYSTQGTALGHCGFYSQKSPVDITYASTSCTITNSVVQVMLNFFSNDATCSGTPTSSSAYVPHPHCEVGSAVASNTFYQCPTETDAYNGFPGYVCVYWDGSSCDPKVRASAFTVTPNGHCENVAGGGASHQAFYHYENNTQTTYTWSAQGCLGSLIDSKNLPVAPPKCVAGTQCFIVPSK